MQQSLEDYKSNIINILMANHDLTENSARDMIVLCDFDGAMKMCNYTGLHDDPEIWAEAIYSTMMELKELEM